MMKKSLRVFFVYGLNFMGLIFGGLALLVLAFCMPVDRIDSNVRASAEYFQRGPYPSIYSWCTSRLDLFTDGLKLLEASNDSEGNAFEKAMSVNHGVVKHYTPDSTLFLHYQKGIDFTEVADYPRYWHGFLIVLKPALYFLTYARLLFLNAFAQIILCFLICFLMFRRGLTRYIIPYLITYLMLMPEALTKCLQFSTCYYLFSLSIVFLLVVPEWFKCKYIGLIFFYIGSLTSYFDFLTYPLVTLGLPAIFVVAMQENQMKTIQLMKIVFTWILGYVAMWSAKWVVASIYLEKNVIADALDKIILRTSDSSTISTTNFTIFQSLFENYRTFAFTPATLFVLLFVLILAFLFICRIKSISRASCKILVPYLLITVLPVLWLSVILNHSCVHVFFTNKICSISVMAFLFGVVDLYTCKKNQESHLSRRMTPIFAHSLCAETLVRCSMALRFWW